MIWIAPAVLLASVLVLFEAHLVFVGWVVDAIWWLRGGRNRRLDAAQLFGSTYDVRS